MRLLLVVISSVRLWAYPQDTNNGLTIPANPEMGVTTDDAHGIW